MQWAGGSFPLSLQLLEGDVVVGVDADFAGDFHGLFRDFTGGEVGVFDERASGGGGVTSAGADGGKRLVRVDNVAGTGDEKGLADIGDQQKGFKVAQHLVC